jgi:hypothetical protein
LEALTLEALTLEALQTMLLWTFHSQPWHVMAKSEKSPLSKSSERACMLSESI